MPSTIANYMAQAKAMNLEKVQLMALEEAANNLFNYHKVEHQKDLCLLQRLTQAAILEDMARRSRLSLPRACETTSEP